MSEEVHREAGQASAKPHHLDSAVTCPRCQAINLHGAKQCEECSFVLAGEPDHKDPGHAALLERQELRRHYRWLTLTSWFFWLGAISYALVTLVAVSAVGHAEVPVGPGVVVVALSTLLTVAMLMAAIQVLLQPMIWTLIVASLATLVSVVHLIGPNPLGLMFLWSAAWAALFWAVLVPMLHLRRLIAKHEDEFIFDHTKHKTQRQLKGRSKTDRHERLVSIRRKAARRAWKVSATAAALVLVASAGGTHRVLASVRPPELAPVLVDFQAEWNQADFSAVGGFFPSELAKQRAAWLEGVADGNGWGRTLPQLSDGKTREEKGSVFVDYQLADFTLSTRWYLDNQERKWILVSIELPLPPLAPELDRFLKAWNGSKLETIAATYPEGNRKSHLEAIERSVKKRNWARLPAIRMGDTKKLSEGKFSVIFPMDTGGEIRTKWLFRNNGRWYLHGLKFPKL